jgi:hypothetical protein
VVGLTNSTNFPVSDPGGGAYFQGAIGSSNYSDASILKFNSSGVRLWATYYGGSSDDWANSVATDPQGNVYVVGGTYSTDFPVQNPGGGTYYQGSFVGGDWDAFILKFNPRGVRQWATYYGGGGDDEARSVATDSQGNVYVVGETYSTNFPVYNPGGAYFQGGKAGDGDAFILKFNPRGVRLWATYYGGGDDDEARSVATDSQGNVYVVGLTFSDDFPVYNPGGGAYYQGSFAGGYYDAFILKFNSSGVRQLATYYGGNGGDFAHSVATDQLGNVYVVGYTRSADFPVYNPGDGAYYQGSRAEHYDAFILKFKTN